MNFIIKIVWFLNYRIGKLTKKIQVKIWTKQVKINCGSFEGKIRAGGKTHVTQNTYLGSNVNFNGMDIRGGGKVIIGNNFHSGIECMMITQNHNIEGDAVPYDSKYIYKDINIEDNVWFGSRVIVLAGVTIGEGAVIQAGSVVVSDIPKCAIAGGHPAKVFKYRNKEHYYKLKEQRKFH